MFNHVFFLILLNSNSLIKAYLRHIDCIYSRQCRDLVYDQVRRALDMVGLIIYDSGSTTQTNNPTLTLLLAKDEINFVKSLRQFEVIRKFFFKKISFFLILVCS